MKEQANHALVALEQKNSQLFRVLGASKLLQWKLKELILAVSKQPETKTDAWQKRQTEFAYIQKLLGMYEQEYKALKALKIAVSEMEIFIQHIHKIFRHEKTTYPIQEIKKISVYLYRYNELVLKDLQQEKQKIEIAMHEIHASLSKYYES